ncbi:MAG TPA: serine/threonine-protein kinase [Kofleriaceae bacterium]
MYSGSRQVDPDGDQAYCPGCNNSFSLDHEFCPNDGAKLIKLKVLPDQLLGRVFDNRYEIRSAVGHGGMGTVYLGWQRSVDREVAVKVIHPKLGTDITIAKRFLREARLSSRLNQPNIVNVYDFGQSEDGILYLVMEMLRGHTLARELESQRPMPIRRIVTMATQICDALESAHTLGIIHRDLKPGNIVILDDPPGRDLIKILDFGLAKSLVNESTSLVTHTDAILGTPLYMPPEQIEGKPSDQRADLYSFGCILYQMVSGRPPFIGENINMVLGAQIRDQAPPLPPGTPSRLVSTIERLMMKNPVDRIPTAALVRDAIGSLDSGFADSYHTAPDVDVAQFQRKALADTMDSSLLRAEPVDPDRPPRRRAWLLVLIALVVAGGTIAVIFGMGSKNRIAPAIDATGEPAAEAGIVVDAMTIVDDAARPAIDARTATRRDAAAAPDARPRPDAAPPRPDAGVRPDAAPPRPPDAAPPRPVDAAVVRPDAAVKPDALDLPLLKRDAGVKK